MRALGRRAHSTRELRKKLEDRALDPADVEATLGYLAERGWLDDRRFAQAFARYRAGRRYGRYRIRRELAQRGVTEELIKEALAEVFPAEREERRLVRQRIERRLARESKPYGEKVLRSLYASLLRAGFSSAIIRDELFRRPEFSRRPRSLEPEEFEAGEDEA